MRRLFFFVKNADTYIMFRRRWFLTLMWCLVTVLFYAREYSVQPGDTLIGLAKKTGVSSLFIRRLNELTSDTLRVGQKLILPDEIQEYTVQQGDSLLGIARRFSTPLSAIILCNQLPHETIYVGQKLIIPLFSEKDTQPPPPPPASKPLIHTVREGETLYSISRRYGVSVNDILTWNKKTSPTLFVGEKLRLFPITPSPSSSPPLVSSPRGDITFPIDISLIENIESTTRGIRIKVRETTALRSTAPGTVEYTGWLYGFGNVIIISLGEEKRLVFGELESISVRKGQKISPGEVIAIVQANQGFYLEIRDGTTVLDPVKWYKLRLAQNPTSPENL
ncbi:MAG: LysM peptidoglycan-binding domain-containing protein [Brevinematales bacterium]|nr:LysM peptidoglycan-binding domain-containing protein [Brevinematales bacterium]